MSWTAVSRASSPNGLRFESCSHSWESSGGQPKSLGPFCSERSLKEVSCCARCHSLAFKVLTLNALGSHVGTGSNPTSPAAIKLPACGLGKQLRKTQSLDILHPCGRPWRCSRLLASERHSSDCCGHLRIESKDRRCFSLYIWLCKKNKYFF